MFLEVGLLVTTLAAVISASIGDEPPQGGSGIDATRAIINKSDPFGGLDDNGVIINETDLLSISDEDIDFYNENSIEERKGCSPTISCTRAGGYCIKGRARCTGTVDNDGCNGGKKCKCCIPDETTTPPVTCPPVTPCPTAPDETTPPPVTCPPITPCPTTPDETTPPPVTCPPITPCPTTPGPFWSNTVLACIRGHNKRELGDVTFEGCKTACARETSFDCRSVDFWPGGKGSNGQDYPRQCQLSTADSTSRDYDQPCYVPYNEKNIYAQIENNGCPEGFLSLLILGTHKCVKVFDDVDRNWYEANLKCRKEGLTMMKTSNENALNIRQALVNLLGDAGSYAWLDAQFDGVQYVWGDGEVIANDNSLWYKPLLTLQPGYCMGLLNSQTFIDRSPSTAYYGTLCNAIAHGSKTFCELSM